MALADIMKKTSSYGKKQGISEERIKAQVPILRQ